MNGIAKLLQRAFMALHRGIYRATGGRLAGSFRGSPVLLLTTTGRRSGRSRTVPIFFTTVGDAYAVIASNGGSPSHPAWFLNLEDDPHASIQVDAKVLRVTPRIAEGEERERIWKGMTSRYSGYDSYQEKTDRKIPVVVLEPTEGG